MALGIHKKFCPLELPWIFDWLYISKRDRMSRLYITVQRLVYNKDKKHTLKIAQFVPSPSVLQLHSWGSYFGKFTLWGQLLDKDHLSTRHFQGYAEVPSTHYEILTFLGGEQLKQFKSDVWWEFSPHTTLFCLQLKQVGSICFCPLILHLQIARRPVKLLLALLWNSVVTT